MTREEIAIQRRETVIQEVVEQFGCYTGFSGRFSDIMARLSRNVFVMQRDKKRDAENAYSVEIDSQIRNLKELRNLCDIYLKRLEKNREAYRTADSDEPTPTWDEFLYQECRKQVKQSAETSA